jgi:GH15 family glucan-1,4-alpha-glucosidase
MATQSTLAETVLTDTSIWRDLDIIEMCAIDTIKGKAVCATPRGSRYPYVYPRDNAQCARALGKLVTSSKNQQIVDRAFALLEEIARYLLAVQREDGYWSQRYDVEGTDRAIYRQEDNVALGMSALLDYLYAAEWLKRIPDWAERIRDAVELAAAYAIEHYYRPEINLFYGTTSIHESRMVEGYDIWTNFAYLRAFTRAYQVSSGWGGFSEWFPTIKEFCRQFEDASFRIFIHDGKYVRRIDPQGMYDERPDFIKLSPFYFGFLSRAPVVQKTTADALAEELWDPELGGLQRYLPYTEDFTCHAHSGNGPWLDYTAVLAQYKYVVGRVEEGDTIMALIESYRTEEGYIAEHLTTPRRFRHFYNTQWNTGVDFQKEFDKECLLPHVPFDLIVEELTHMRNAYNRVKQDLDRNPDVRYLRFATPLMRAHAEHTLAVLARQQFCSGIPQLDASQTGMKTASG